VLVSEQADVVSQALIAAASGVPGYTINTAGAGSVIFTRKYSPTWAIVVAVIGVLFFLLGLLALLVKETETLTATVTPVKNGTRVVFSGIATRDIMARVISALESMPTLATDAPSDAVKQSDERTKVCPDCAETVKMAAMVCRFCAHGFGADSTPAIV
jgi:hypothetical protein